MTPEEVNAAAQAALADVDKDAALLTALAMLRAYMVADTETGGALLPTSYTESLVVISTLFGLTHKALDLVGDRTGHTALEVLDRIHARTVASIGQGATG